MDKRTLVDEQRYVFTSEVEHDELRAFVTVHWAALPFAPEETFLRPLREYLRPRHEVAEVWMVYPPDMDELFVALQDTERFPTVDETGTPRLYRFFTINETGNLVEQRATTYTDAVPVTPALARLVIEDGLRQLFRDTESLASATAGFHFTHPSGSHSAHFIRASQAVSRTQHSYFVAMALLDVFSCRSNLTIWVDTAGIATVGYTFADLLRRFGVVHAIRVETFTGYGGLDASLNPLADDLVLISGSTSGSLARTVIAKKKLPADQVATLFYLGAPMSAAEAGDVLCDLTNRDEDVTPSVRDARIAPYTTFKGEPCDLCASGSGEIVLDGDSFFPAARALHLRMPSLLDRPLDGKRARISKAQATHFDGQGYFEDLFGHSAIVYATGTAVEASAHAVSTRLSHLLEPGAFPGPARRIATALDAAIAGAPPVAVVISLPDTDSAALGHYVASRLFGDRPSEVAAPDGMRWRVWRGDGGDGLAGLTEDCTVLICAGVVGSGRQLTSISRELRKVDGGFQPRYFVGAAHPESSTTWSILEQTLGRVSSTGTSRLTPVWKLPREPRFPGAPTPWTRESDQLQRVGDWLAEQTKYKSLVATLEARGKQLGALSSDTLFVGATSSGSDVRMRDINRSFALWPFAWETHVASPEGAIPTHAEIYATIAHLLYESRRLSPEVERRTITVRRHGYALHPAIFDRLNDPVIQAAVLRAAEPGELHYDQDPDASRAVADLLTFVLSNVTTEAGDASYEFVLSLVEGLDSTNSHGLRIDDKSLHMVLRSAEASYGTDFEALQTTAPRVAALLLYIRDT
ncbi:hypothetical protein [uncultured Microbacterium sp.]|uniref:hypothetical protein n=1 Tax=uncultured Microbacterium sp. TaxID=191216 RepID=UPI0025D70A1C|nr:hypothetical protein [uncultured Microbacterium sp.]